MSFIWPFMLLLLALIPLLIGLYALLQRRRQAAAASLGPLGQVQSSSGGVLGKRRHVPPVFFLFGFTLLVFGLARPEMIVDLPHVEGTVILAFDVSSSMTADDLAPTRIEAAKAAARAFVENQPQTIKIGVVAFSNGGLVVQQPTNDQAAILEAIDRLTPDGGTVLGQGIFTSLNAIAGQALAIDEASLEELQLEDYSSAVVLLLTDGEDTGGQDPLEIAQVAAEAGVRIYPIGIGTAEGTVVQLDGFNVLTQLNEPALQEIASLTNGQYYQAKDEESLQDVYQNVDLQLTIEGEKSEVTSLFTGLSLLLLLVGGLLSLFWFGRAP
jgi:Ca-activated chloride channel homolog